MIRAVISITASALTEVLTSERAPSTYSDGAYIANPATWSSTYMTCPQLPQSSSTAETHSSLVARPFGWLPISHNVQSRQGSGRSATLSRVRDTTFRPISSC